MSFKIAIAAIAITTLYACSETEIVGGGSSPAARSKDNDATRGASGDDAADGADGTDGDVVTDDGVDTPEDGDDGSTDGDVGADDSQADDAGDDLGADDSEAGVDGGIKTDDDEIKTESIEQLVSIPSGGTFTVNGATKPGFLPQLQALVAGDFNSRYSGGHGLRNEPTTAAEACKKMGFLDGRATAAGNWSSPYNETMWFFSGSWQFVKSRSGDKNHIRTLECRQTCSVKHKGEANEEKTCTPY